MSPYEMTSLAFEITGLIDSTFQTWMGATFAFIVATHVAGASLNIKIKLFVALLYFACSSLLYFRYTSFAREVFYYFSQLAAQDVHTVDMYTAQSVGLVRRLVFIIGTVGAVVFLFIPTGRSQVQDGEQDS